MHADQKYETHFELWFDKRYKQNDGRWGRDLYTSSDMVEAFYAGREVGIKQVEECLNKEHIGGTDDIR